MSGPREENGEARSGDYGEERERSDGAWIWVVSPDSVDGELGDVFRSIGARRGVSDILGVQSLNPAALSAHHELYRTLMFGPSPLSRAEREAVAVVELPPGSTPCSPTPCWPTLASS